MARSSRRDAPDVDDVVDDVIDEAVDEAETSSTLPAVPDDGGNSGRALDPAPEPQPGLPAVPADADEPAALGSGEQTPMPEVPDSAPHELLTIEEPPAAIDKPGRAEKSAKPEESEPAQLISGDPLLGRAVPASDENHDVPPATKEEAPAPAEPPAGPPPPPTSARRSAPPPPPVPPVRQPRPQSPAVSQRSPGVGGGAIGGVPGVTATASGQTARRAARGAQVTAPQTALPPRRTVEQPVATLRPTTVAPVPRLAGRRPRVRRVTRVVRHVDPWSVFKVAAAFSVVAYAIALVAGVLLWNVAYATGTIDNIERGMESTGWETFELDGGEIFHNAWVGGIFIAVSMTGLAVLVATLFNLITDLVGGVRFTVLEEEVVEKTASPMRRFAMAPGSRPVTGGRPVPNAEERVRRARGD